MRVALIALTLAWPVAAQAQGSSSLEEQAYKCWNLPAGLDTVFASEFDVVLDEKGKVKDITVARYDESVRDGRKLVLSASRAIELCAPYRTAKTGTVRFVMDPAPFFTEATPIDPFKAKQD